jgi:hypothetical protein
VPDPNHRRRARLNIYEAFIEGQLEAPKHLAREVQWTNPPHEEFQFLQGAGKDILQAEHGAGAGPHPDAARYGIPGHVLSLLIANHALNLPVQGHLCCEADFHPCSKEDNKQRRTPIWSSAFS